MPTVEKRIPKRKLPQSNENEKSAFIQDSDTKKVTPKIFGCINLYPEDVTNLKKPTISHIVQICKWQNQSRYIVKGSLRR
jgi:hypothetical protein